MSIGSDLAGSRGTYTDPSIYVDQILAGNISQPAAILGNLQGASNKILTEIEVENLYVSNPDYPHPLRLIEQLHLPGFTFPAWEQFSEQENKISARYRAVGNRLVSETLLRLAIQNFSGQSRPIYVEAFILGDFSELRQLIAVISSNEFYVPGIELSWKGFCPDPHEIYDTHYKAQLKFPSLAFPGGTIEGTESRMSSPFPEYDGYSKWMSGPDGSGLLNDQNILWLSANAASKSVLVIGSLHRPHYLDDSPSRVDLYYRLALGVLACVSPRGTGVLKISLPVNRALLGIYSLFSLFFNRVRLIKFKQHPLDDDTVYLIGTDCLGAPIQLFPILLRDRSVTPAILDYFSRQASSMGAEFNRIFGPDLEGWIRQLEEVWSIRNR